MSEPSGSDSWEVLGQLIIATLTIGALIYLIPLLFRVVWQIFPGVLVIAVIIALLGGMVNKLLK